MSSHWPTADQQPGATPAQIEFARRWRDMPKVVFSSMTSAVDWNARPGDAVEPSGVSLRHSVCQLKTSLDPRWACVLARCR